MIIKSSLINVVDFDVVVDICCQILNTYKRSGRTVFKNSAYMISRSLLWNYIHNYEPGVSFEDSYNLQYRYNHK